MIVRQLHYLATLTRERHFGRAAAACHVSQPTLSAGIRRLEEELGFPIVRRSQRYEGLTPEGERVLEWALRILADVDGLYDEVGAMRHGLSGQLRIGAIPTSLSSVSLLTTPLCARHPGITVSVHSLNSRQIERGLHAFELEVGLTLSRLRASHGRPHAAALHRALHAADPCRRPVHRPGQRALGGRRPGRRSACSRRTCRTAASSTASSTKPAWHPSRAIETNSISTLYAHVRDGGWSSVIAHTWLHLFDVPAELRAIPLIDPVATRSIGLVVLDRDPEPLLARALLEIADTLDVEAALSR